MSGKKAIRVTGVMLRILILPFVSSLHMHNTSHDQAKQVLMTIWTSQKKESRWQVKTHMRFQEHQCLRWME